PHWRRLPHLSPRDRPPAPQPLPHTRAALPPRLHYAHSPIRPLQEIRSRRAPHLQRPAAHLIPRRHLLPLPTHHLDRPRDVAGLHRRVSIHLIASRRPPICTHHPSLCHHRARSLPHHSHHHGRPHRLPRPHARHHARQLPPQ